MAILKAEKGAMVQTSIQNYFKSVKSSRSFNQDTVRVKDELSSELPERKPSLQSLHAGLTIRVVKAKNDNPKESISSFVYFLKLPLELQVKIFKLAVADIGLRMVTFAVKDLHNPGLAGACKLSRSILEKQQTKILLHEYDLAKEYHMWVDYEIDTILLERSDWRYFPLAKMNAFREAMRKYPALLRPVTKLAISIPEGGLDEINSDCYDEFWPLLKYHCRSLQQLSFVANHRRGAGFDTLVEHKEVISPGCLMYELQRSLNAAQLNGILENLRLRIMMFKKAKIEEL